jgi:FOG: EAL domain
LSADFPADSVIAYFGNFEFALFEKSFVTDEQLEALKKNYSYSAIAIGDYTYSVEMCLGQHNIEANIDAAKAIGDATFTMRSVFGTNGFYRVYDPPLNTTLDISKELMKDLSFENVEQWFHLVYQPVVDIVTNRVVGAEALLRWTHPEMGPVSPAIFIPIAERTNAIFILGELVIKKCCEFLTKYRDRLPHNFRLLVNISKREIDDDAHINKLIHQIINSYVPFNAFEFEITETMASRNIEQVIAFTKKMNTIGARIALDDFGSGNTALAYISDLNCSTVKIDTSMSDGAMGDARRTKLLTSISNMCRDMELDTIMEHVETQSTMDYFAECGYRLVQGYLFSKPLTAEALAEFAQGFDMKRYLKSGG